ERCELQDSVRMVERHAEGGSPAAVVTGDQELFETEMLHCLDLVLAHAAERIVAAVLQPTRLSAVAVAAQVRRHHGEIFRKSRRDEMPMHVREGVAVEKQHRWTAAAIAQIDFHFGVAGLN